MISFELSFAGSIAAIFAYLAWVRMTTQRRTDVQETMRNWFEGLFIEENDWQIEITKVTVDTNADNLERLRNNLLPFGVYGDQTTFWCHVSSHENPIPANPKIQVPEPGDYSVDIDRAESETVVFRFDSVDKEEIQNKIDRLDLDGLLNEVYRSN